MRGSLSRTSALLTTVLAACAVSSCATVRAVPKVTDLVTSGDSRELRTRPKGSAASSPDKPAILLLALDGIDRATLYELLRKGELPHFSELLSGEDGKFPHAHFDDHLLSTMPSSTMAAWTTAMTGRPPADHGVTGNEFFMRESRLLGAPAPVSFEDPRPTVAAYTEAYLDGLKFGPSVYDRLREHDPDILIWDAMHPLHSGVDRIFVTRPTILAQAFEHFIEIGVKEAKNKAAGEKDNRTARDAFEKLDNQLISDLVDGLDKGVLPDVLTVYISGTDLYAHVAEEGPDEARRTYLKQVTDPAIGKLLARLKKRGALENRYVVVTADHGHTQVVHDKAHALGTTDKDDPPELMKKAGFRVRPFKMEVDKDDDFDAVFVGGGATAYVYVADRSTCPGPRAKCDWARAPRYEEDVLPLADAFWKNDGDGSLVPEMKGAIDMVLTRRPKPFKEVDLPFEVYVGNGKTVPVDTYLAEHPHPSYVDMAHRLHDLAAGVHGERAGDVMLLAHNGDRATPEERYYFAAPYRSWHGSPSHQDSDIPLIVAHPKHSSETLGRRTANVLGNAPYQQKVTDLIIDLREKK